MTQAMTQRLVSPVIPTSTASVCRRPIGLHGIRIEGGLWAERRRTSREATIPHGAAQLEAAGNLANFRLAAGRGRGDYRAGLDNAGGSLPFLDTDVYKWLEAIGWELATQPDAALTALADPVIELVAAAQRPDGYLNTYFQVGRPARSFMDLQWGHELYTVGHLVQAGIAWRRGVGDDRLLAIAERAVDRVEAELGAGRRELVDGHPEIEMALVELYRTTGTERHLDLARTLIERRGRGLLGSGRFGSGYWQDREPVRVAREPIGHAVRQVYLDCGAVDVAIETGDEDLLAAVVDRWEAMVASRTYITGGLGSHHRDEAFGDPYQLPPDRAYAETCAAIGSVMLAWRLLLATGQRRFADLAERTMFNAVLPGLGLDGRHFFYSNPLQRRTNGVAVSEGASANRRAPWFACACCPPNLMRFLATVPDLFATVTRDGVQLHQFASATIHAPMEAGTASLAIETRYPWDGIVGVTVTEAPAAPWTLSIGVPGWCDNVSATLDGLPVALSGGRDVISVARAWQRGDRVELRMEMPARFTVPDRRIDAVRGTVAIERGPLVYAVETDDVPPDVTLEALEVDPRSPLGTTKDASEPALRDLTLVAFDASVRDDPESSPWPYARADSPPTRNDVARSVAVRAVPYFAWGNRTARGMRVWLPATTRGSAAGALDQAEQPDGEPRAG
jgi:hypothetical protein